jgi:diketogulonate reductase-like aldo/keto reductase
MEIPDIGLGTYELRGDDCTEAVATALDAGYRHVDTAQMYENEAAVGDGIARADVDREDVFLATKVWRDRLGYGDAIESTYASLDRLGVDAVDLLYVHWPLNTYDADETLRALDALVNRGKVDRVGLSNFTPELLVEARVKLDAPVYAHQVEMHPCCPQDDLLDAAHDYGHRLVAYCPIARGAVDDVPAVREVAARHDATPAQVSLAWLMAKGVVPIPKSASPDHIRENLAARKLDLTAADVERIDGVERRERVVDFPDAPWN